MQIQYLTWVSFKVASKDTKTKTASKGGPGRTKRRRGTSGASNGDADTADLPEGKENSIQGFMTAAKYIATEEASKQTASKQTRGQGLVQHLGKDGATKQTKRISEIFSRRT